jgi:ankyrin repeat protein
MTKPPLGLLLPLLAAASFAASPPEAGPTFLLQGPCNLTKETVEDLVDIGQVDALDKDGNTALHCAAVQGSAELASILLDHGAKTDVRNRQGQTALQLAAAQERSHTQDETKVMTVLLDHGADVNAADSRNETPLQVASMRANAVLVKLLLDRGAKPEIADVDGMTPLLWASASDTYVPVIGMLLDHGAKSDAAGAFGMTALHLAAANGAPKAAELLLSRGAPLDVVDKEGRTPLAASCGKTAAQVLLAHGADKSRLSAEQRNELAKSGEIRACPVYAPQVSEDNKRRSEQHYLSGMIYYQKEDYENARKEWRKAVKLDPGNDDAAFGLKRLEKLWGPGKR